MRRDTLISAVVDALDTLHPSPPVGQPYILSGNGSRIPGLAEAFARAGLPVQAAELDSIAALVPSDVLRAAGADWSLAVGLALWEIAA